MAKAGPDQTVFSVPPDRAARWQWLQRCRWRSAYLRWAFTSRPAGSQATLSNPTLVNPTFVADARHVLVQLIVNDGILDSLAGHGDHHRGQHPPGGQCRPRSARRLVGQTVQLDGSGSSDADDDDP